MDWPYIRAHYASLVARTGLTQHAIAERGGLKGQGAISKLLANTHLGPSVETFVRAVIGTGTDVSVFFAAIEHRAGLPTPASPPADSAPALLRELELACQTLAALLSSWSRAAASEAGSTRSSVAPQDGRAHGGQSPDAAVSEGGRSPTPRAELDVQRIEAIIQASTARILADIALLDKQVDTGDGRPARVSGDAPKP